MIRDIGEIASAYLIWHYASALVSGAEPDAMDRAAPYIFGAVTWFLAGLLALRVILTVGKWWLIAKDTPDA